MWLKCQQDSQSYADVHDKSVKCIWKKFKDKKEKVKLQAKMEALQLREDLAVTNARLRALEEIDPTESKAGTTFRPEDGMNTYLEN